MSMTVTQRWCCVWPIVAATLCVFASAHATTAPAPTKKPQRIVSTNLCIDQLLLLMVPRERIIGLSYLTGRNDLSNVPELAQGIPTVHANAEEVLLMQPDLILTSTYTNRATMKLMQKFGVPVVTLDTHIKLDGVRQQLRELGAAVGEKARAEELINQLDFPPLPATNSPITALSYSTGGSVDGANTLVDSMMAEAGLLNIARVTGLKDWGYFPLEKLVWHPPALLVTYDYRRTAPSMTKRLLEHPALHQTKTNRIVLPAPLVLCPGPWNAQAVQRLRAARLFAQENPL